MQNKEYLSEGEREELAEALYISVLNCKVATDFLPFAQISEERKKHWRREISGVLPHISRLLAEREALAVAATIEAAAKICDTRAEMYDKYACDCHGYRRASEHDSEEIRALTLADAQQAMDAHDCDILIKRDMEWWEQLVLNDAVAPTPEAAKKWLLTLAAYEQKEHDRDIRQQASIWASTLRETLEFLVQQVDKSNAIDDHGHALVYLEALRQAKLALAAYDVTSRADELCTEEGK